MSEYTDRMVRRASFYLVELAFKKYGLMVVRPDADEKIVWDQFMHESLMQAIDKLRGTER